jgi:hypothetical protein
MLDVLVEYPRGMKAWPDLMAKAADSLALATVQTLAAQIKARIQGRGDLAGQVIDGYDDRHRPKWVDGKYSPGGPAPVGDAGARAYATGAVFARAIGANPRKFSPSGGMWSGLSVVLMRLDTARIMFRGRSRGQDPRWRDKRSAGVKENNALKAWTVFAKKKVNILAPSELEIEGAQALAVTRLASALELSTGEK